MFNQPSAMASSDSNHVDQVVELIERDPLASNGDAESVSEQSTPLLIQTELPKINIFNAPYPRRKNRDEVTRTLESETSSMTQLLLWVWSGSRYSGLLCMALSSTIYFLMEVLSDIFSGMFCTGLCLSLHDAFNTYTMTGIIRRRYSGIGCK